MNDTSNYLLGKIVKSKTEINSKNIVNVSVRKCKSRSIVTIEKEIKFEVWQRIVVLLFFS